MSLMCMDFPPIRLSEQSNSILDFEDGCLQVDYTCSPAKELRLLVFALSRRRFKNPIQSVTLRPRTRGGEGLAYGGRDKARGDHRGRHGFRPRQRRSL